MKVTTTMLAIAAIALVAVACKNVKYKKTKEGIPYKVYGDGKGEQITAGSVITYHTTSRLGDSLLGTSYGDKPRWQAIPTDSLQLDEMRFFLEAHKGDSILLLQQVDSILAKSPNGAPQDSFLLKNRGKEIRTFIKVVEVYKDRETAAAIQEKDAIDNFLKQPENAKQFATDAAAIEAYLKLNPGAVRKTNMGVSIQTIKPGNGQKAKTGDYMMLRYVGKDFAGKIFDSNVDAGKPLMPLQVGAGGTIPGFADGVKQLTKGEKALIVIPSQFGYGQQGNPPVIQPNQNLVFEIEVVDITDKAPAPPPMTMPDTTRK